MSQTTLHRPADTTRQNDATQPTETTRARTPAVPRYQQVVDRAVGWLARYSIDMLRVSIGLVFVGFGVLKFFPGASPAEDLAIRTLDTLSMGILSGDTARVMTAVAEVFVGVTLVTGKLLRIGLLVLGASLVGIMSPLVLFAGDMFPGTPTLEAQYVLKDIVLVAAALVVTAHALGARLVRR